MLLYHGSNVPVHAPNLLKRLLPQRMKDQLAFRTEAGIALLRFAEVRYV